jgi:5-methylthioadenosine/S-adenosylhomocysteine deaminase
LPENILIKDGTIITMDKDNRILDKASLIISGNRILDIDKTDAIKRKYRADQTIDATNKMILPGLVNTHHHPGMITSLNFGVEKFVLEDFLNDIYYPMLAGMTSEDAYWCAMLAYAQAIRQGETCLNDMFCKTLDRAKAAEEIGVRVVLSSEVADLVPGQDTIQDNEKAVIEKNNAASGRIKVWFGLEWIPVCSSELLEKTRELANTHKTGIHIHLNESLKEVELCKKKYGKRPTEYLYEMGFLGDDVVAGHSIWLSDEEIQMMKKTRTNIAHCPAQNMKTAGGVARVVDMLSAGINVGLGTDAYPDMFETLRCAKMIQHITRLDATIMPASKIFEMATTDGARALGLEEEIGSLQPGKKADLIVLNLKTLRLTPRPTAFRGQFNPFPSLLWTSSYGDIETVIVDGRITLNDGTLQTIDETRLMDKANETFQNLLEKI